MPKLSPKSRRGCLPQRAGVGLKPEHYRTILDTRPDIGFFEVHAENYMGQGGPPHRYLEAIAAHYPLSLHGVGLSIGADRRLDKDHLQRLKALIARYDPAMFSEHLAWSSHDTGFLNDLLPLPYNATTMARVTNHIDEVQTVLGRQMLLENPSTYLTFTENTWSETDFIAEITRRTGCGLLLDINNVHVATTNQQWDPLSYIASYPLAAVQEIHLAGHSHNTDESGQPLLIDTHNRPVDDVVWDLFATTIKETGPVATLIEWDADLPSWAVLRAEADRADQIIQSAVTTACHAAA